MAEATSASESAGAGENPKMGFGIDAVVVDVEKVLPAPAPAPEMETKAAPLHGGAARGPGERDSITVDIKCDAGKGASGGDRGSEKLCRICHLSQEGSESSSELMELGCGCKDDLALSHRHCSEAWFKLKGNRLCEICGVVAKNVTGVEEDGFLEEWSEGRIAAPGDSGDGSVTTSRRCWRSQPFCNFLMACLVISFILPWFFRVNIF